MTTTETTPPEFDTLLELVRSDCINRGQFVSCCLVHLDNYTKEADSMDAELANMPREQFAGIMTLVAHQIQHPATN
jgi:hypothetical protein